MISPELLRRFPFFGALEEPYLKKVAMNADEKNFDAGVTLLEQGQPAKTLFFMIDGGVDLYFKVEEAYKPESSREFSIGEINPGEPFGLSACIEPYIFTSTARTSEPTNVIAIDAEALRELCENDKSFAYIFMGQISKALIDRLNLTRIQLAAAHA